MKGKKIIGLCAVIAVLVIGLAWYAFARPTELGVIGTDFSGKVKGNVLELTLNANPTTGYNWFVNETPEEFRCEAMEYVPDAKAGNAKGAGGKEQLRIVAEKEGTGTMVLEYRRDWEGGESAGEYLLTLEISRSLGKLKINSICFEPK